MNGVQCDTCFKFTAAPPIPSDWFILVKPSAQPALPPAVAAIFGGSAADHAEPEQPRTFCSAACLAGWATGLFRSTGTAGGGDERPFGWPSS